MTKRLKWFLTIILCFGLLKPAIAGVTEENLEWKAEVGDSLTLTYTKFIDKAKNNQVIQEGTDEEGNKVNITLQKGTTVKYTIISFTSRDVRGKIEMNGILFAANASILTSIRKTTDNKTYWEEYYKDWEGFSIKGNHIVYETEVDYGNLHHRTITKWSWKTGWKIYDYVKSTNNSQVTREVELTSEPGLFDIPGYELFSPIVAIITTRVMIKRRKIRHKTDSAL